MAGFDDLGEGARKIFLAGVGAIALGADKGKDIVDELVAKGELTVEQGKQLNTELKRRAKDDSDAFAGTALKQHIKNMSAEQRAEFVKKVNDLAKEADSAANADDADKADAKKTSDEA